MAGATPDRNCVSGAKDIGRAHGLAARLQGLMAYDGVRIALGALLLTAAALKGHQLATEPVAETSLLTSRWFLIASLLHRKRVRRDTNSRKWVLAY